jgi:murein DD-endopeptidase MepM/ murein hydrolase activator NlpD
MIKIFSILLFSFSMLFSKAGVTYSISDTTIANAKTMMFDLSLQERVDKAYVAFLGKRYPFFKKPNGNGYYALVPTSYYQKPKSTKATIVYIIDGEKHYISTPIDIVDAKYKSERLKVNPKKAKFDKAAKIRIAKESKEAKKIYAKYTPTLYINEPFMMPLNSKITSAFGNKRVFNGSLKSYHSGTDFRAKTGTPLVAANRGKVVLVKNRFFAGNSVIIDHGQGIYSGYYHMSKFAVKVGQMVEKGDLLGYAGATGRVTGPHLHYTFHIGGVCVDPMQFTEVSDFLFY